MSYGRGGGRTEAAAVFAKAFRSRGWTRHFAKAIVLMIAAMLLLALLANIMAR